MSSGPSIPIPFAIGEPLWLAEGSPDDRPFALDAYRLVREAARA